MEKKTIGALIAALRKANGMTQRELAERLNVSDKTVSRWERDDGAPDLSLIPVIAELFGVTCDELLRGERKSPEERAEPAEAQITARGEKSLRYLLSAALQRFRMQSLIAGGVAVAGLIGALIANQGCNRAYIGFFIALALCLAGAVVQFIFTDRAWHAVPEEMEEDAPCQGYRWRVFRIALAALGVCIGVLTFCVPLICVGDAYVGLLGSQWCTSGGLLTLIVLVLWCAVCLGIRAGMLRKGMLILPPQGMAGYHANTRLKGKVCLIAAILLLVTAATHGVNAIAFSAENIAENLEFSDYDSFIAYMETPVDYADSGFGVYALGDDGKADVNAAEFNNTLRLKDGTAVCEYVHRNWGVQRIDYQEKDGSLLPIRVITRQAYRAATHRVDLMNFVFGLFYTAEVVGCTVFYFTRRKRWTVAK